MDISPSKRSMSPMKVSTASGKSFSRMHTAIVPLNTTASSRNIRHTASLHEAGAKPISHQTQQLSRIQSDEMELELSHMNNLDMWRITTCERLRVSSDKHLPKLGRSASSQHIQISSTTPKQKQQQQQQQLHSYQEDKSTGPKIKMDIIDTIMQNDFSFVAPSNIPDESTSSNPLSEQAQSQDSHYSKQSNGVLKPSTAGLNQEFIRNESNKIVIQQLVTNKLRSIYKQNNKIDYLHVVQERPRIESTLKNFKNLKMTLNQTQLNLHSISSKLIADRALSQTKIFDFSADLKRIESERLDFVAKEKRIHEKMQFLKHHSIVTKENKKLLRAFIFEIIQKIGLFNVKIVSQKFTAVEKLFVENYFVERKRGDSSSLNTAQIKDKLKQDEDFLKYLDRLKEMKAAEEKEYIEAKRILDKILITLKAQFKELKANSLEIKENYTKGNVQLREMYLDLMSTHLDIFLQSHNMCWIARGFAMIGEEMPLHKLPRYLNQNSIDYILESGKIMLEIQKIEERKPSFSVHTNKETEDIIEIIKEAVDIVNGTPLISSVGNRVLGQSMSKIQSFVDLGIEDGQQVSSNPYVNLQVESIAPHESHYKQLQEQTRIQQIMSEAVDMDAAIEKLLPNQSYENLQRQQEYQYLDPLQEKKQKELSSQLLRLKRKEISRLIDSVSNKVLKPEIFNQIVHMLFGDNENDRLLQDYRAKQQAKINEISLKNISPLRSIQPVLRPSFVQTSKMFGNGFGNQLQMLSAPQQISLQQQQQQSSFVNDIKRVTFVDRSNSQPQIRVRKSISSLMSPEGILSRLLVTSPKIH